MTTIEIDLKDEQAAAGLDPASGYLTFRYVNEFDDPGSDGIVTTNPFRVEITDGVGTADILPTEAGNGVSVRSYVRGVRSRTVTIPDTATVQFRDLPEVDPDTLSPVEPPAAWTLALEEAVDALVADAPGALDTLNELAAALGDDANFAATVAASLATKVETVAGLSGTTIGTSSLKTALSLPGDTATAISDEIATRIADVDLVRDELDDGLATKQPLAAMLTKLAALASTLTEGQLIRWDATLGEPVAMNPVGNSLNAAAMNNSGSATAFSSAAATIPSTAISVTNSNGRSVNLDFQGCFIQTVVGTGTAYLALYETTGGSNTYRAGAKVPLPNSTNANLANLTWDLTRLPIGAVTTTRTFELRAQILVASGTPTASVANAPTNPTVLQAINL